MSLIVPFQSCLEISLCVWYQMKEEKMPLIMKYIVRLNLAWQWRYPTDKTGFLFIGTHCITYKWEFLFCCDTDSMQVCIKYTKQLLIYVVHVKFIFFPYLFYRSIMFAHQCIFVCFFFLFLADHLDWKNKFSETQDKLMIMYWCYFVG